MSADAPAVGDWVKYYSPFRTGVYDAKIARDNGDGTVAVHVFLTGAAVGRRGDAEPMITLRSVSYGPEGRARPERGE